ncbi:hypothetical protein HCJ39_07215 [Listeria rocourtiae]|uniref:hypothetical protein n=1 Tax=Listeria rocourtiae TaxID=647910 RepID=UPI0016274BC2|nr:hypothetical protein [Listeria rocourtiae]MBC1604500.1 hypothetical protein [Listeria rocourtiae]
MAKKTMEIADMHEYQRKTTGIYEILEIGQKSAFRNLFEYGKMYYTVGARVIERFEDDSYVHHNVCLTVREDKGGDYIDFSKTRFSKQFTEKLYLTAEQKGKSA